MKLLKYLPIALLAVAATACTEDGPNPNDIAPGVYFSKANVEKVSTKAADSTATVSVAVCRTFETVGTQVGLTNTVEKQVEAEDGTLSWQAATAEEAAYFQIPTSCTFDNTYSKTTFKVVIDNTKLAENSTYRINMAFAQGTQVSAYGKGTYSLTVHKEAAEEWESIGNATYVDGWVVGGFGVNVADYPWEVPMERHKRIEGLYRLVNPYCIPECPVFEQNTNPQKSTENYYIEIDVKNPMVPKVAPSVTGFSEPTNGEFTIVNYEGWLAAEGLTDEQIVSKMIADKVQQYQSTYAKGVLTVRLPQFWVSVDAGGPYNWNNIQNSVITWPEQTAAAASTGSAKTAQKVNGKAKGVYVNAKF